MNSRGTFPPSPRYAKSCFHAPAGQLRPMNSRGWSNDPETIGFQKRHRLPRCSPGDVWRPPSCLYRSGRNASGKGWGAGSRPMRGHRFIYRADTRTARPARGRSERPSGAGSVDRTDSGADDRSRMAVFRSTCRLAADLRRSLSCSSAVRGLAVQRTDSRGRMGFSS